MMLRYSTHETGAYTNLNNISKINLKSKSDNICLADNVEIYIVVNAFFILARNTANDSNYILYVSNEAL